MLEASEVTQAERRKDGKYNLKEKNRIEKNHP